MKRALTTTLAAAISLGFLSIAPTGCMMDMGEPEVEKKTQAVICPYKKVERARYCTNYFLGICTNSYSPYHLRMWENNGVSNDNQKKLYLSMWSKPYKYSVEHIALFMAGQQSGSGKNNAVTGQYAGYEDGCDRKTASCYESFSGYGMAAQVYNGGYFPLSKTFFAVALNAQFNHTMSSGNKQETIDGYIDWLKYNVDFSKLKSVYLAGSSRGGCLAMRLAKQLKRDHGLADVPFVVHSFDGVCKKSQGELGTYSYQVDNPVSGAPSNYRSWKTSMYGQYSYSWRNSLAIRHLASGDEVTIWDINITGVHSFSHYGATGTDTTLNNGAGAAWYEQKWVNLTHSQVGSEVAYRYYTVYPFLDHLDDALDRFHCTDGQTWDAGLGRCTGGTTAPDTSIPDPPSSGY